MVIVFHLLGLINGHNAAGSGCIGFYLLLHRGRYGGDDVVGTMRRRLGRIAALLLMLRGEDAVVAE